MIGGLIWGGNESLEYENCKIKQWHTEGCAISKCYAFRRIFEIWSVKQPIFFGSYLARSTFYKIFLLIHSHFYLSFHIDASAQSKGSKTCSNLNVISRFFIEATFHKAGGSPDPLFLFFRRYLIRSSLTQLSRIWVRSWGITEPSKPSPMSLLRPASHCIICGGLVIGRPDKVFCSLNCKTKYHYRRKQERLPISYPTDNILHRNWAVLNEAYELAQKRKFFINAVQLQKEGFRPEYYTTSSVNRDGKIYYYVYDYGWMQFSEKELMVIKLSKPR